VKLISRLRRWLSEQVVGEMHRNLYWIVSFERNVAAVRDANGIAICFSPVPGQPHVTCPRCLMTSYSPDDIREGYCGNCHDWTSRRPGPAQG
jgi:hypothetical protein